MPIKTHNSTPPSSSSGSNPPSPQPRPHRRPKRRRRFGHQPRPNNKPTEYRQEVSAGGIIYRRRAGVMEIFFIKDMFGKWTFPKGKPELNESLEAAAIRECGEEVGLFGLRHIMPLGRTSFRFRRQGAMVQKTVHFFLLEARPDAKEKFKGSDEVAPGREHITEGKWVRLPQVFQVSSYKNSDRLLARALRRIAPRPREPAASMGADQSAPPAAPAAPDLDLGI